MRPGSYALTARGRPSHALASFVGRVDELAGLQAAANAPPSIVIVDGEAGVGKSRLVEQFATDARATARTLLVGRCLTVQEPFPLAPLLDALRAAADELPPPEELNPIVGALSGLLGDIADRLPPALAPLGDRRAELHRVFVAVSELLRRSGADGLIIEDVHWADSQTWEFLAYLVANQPPGLMLVLTVRSSAVERLPIWEALVRAPAGPPRRISLPPLPVADVRRLAENVLDVPALPDRFVASLYEKTAGIPFVVEEVLSALTQRMPADRIARHPDPLRDLAVPTALRDVILQRLMSLDETAREVLGAAAVIAPSIDEELVARVTGRDADQVARSLTSALAIAVLYEDHERCHFRHVLAQQVVYESLPSPTRRRLHGRTARALEDRPGSPPVAQLAHHHRRAGNAAEFVRYAEAAADLASSHGDDATAARFLLDTMSVDGLAPQTRTRLAIRLGQSAVEGLAQAETVPVLERLLVDDDLPGADRGRVRFLLGRLLRQQGQMRRGHLEIERAVPDLAAEPELQARALAILAVPDTVVDRHIDEHLERCAEAEAAAARCDSDAADLAVRIARVSLWMEIGDGRYRDALERLRSDRMLRANPREHARACLNWAQDALRVGLVGLAEGLYEEACRVVEDAGYLRVAGVLDLIGAEIDHVAGRWDGLESRIRRLSQEPDGYPAASLEVRFLLGAHLACVGGADEAEGFLRDVVDSAERVGTVWPLIPARATLSRLLLTKGDHEAALEQARAGLRHVRAKGNWAWGADSVLSLVDACASLDRLEDAIPVVEEFVAGLADADAPVARAAALVGRVVIDPAADGEPLLHEVRRVLGTAGSRYDEALTYERLGRWRCVRGADGLELLHEALRLYGGLGATRDVGRVRQELRRHGVAVPYPWRGGRRSYGTDLSPRELEVATLAADGRTNQEIAAELFVSPRTVETHVANALRKLGGRSRKQLPALLRPDDGS